MVLEFLGLEETPAYSESDLETAIIDRLQHFLLELGKGFLFEARQKRFSFDDSHFFVDLVFYNRLLRCHVLIDLKTGKLTHQDLGQMQMYVNYFDRYVKIDGELPTVGILLCDDKNDAVVELTLPEDANIYASKYQLYLPSREELADQVARVRREIGGEGGAGVATDARTVNDGGTREMTTRRTTTPMTPAEPSHVERESLLAGRAPGLHLRTRERSGRRP